MKMNPNRDPKPNENQRYVLLDTNVISALGREGLNDQILDLLREVAGYGLGIAISDFTYFEILNEASLAKEEQAVGTLSGVSTFYVKKEVLIAAAHMACFYKEHDIPMKQINEGDRIIAATAVLNNCVILTENARDFPPPFFKEIERRVLTYDSKDYPVAPVYYFLEPQSEYIAQCHSKRIEPYVEKMRRAAQKAAHEAEQVA